MQTKNLIISPHMDDEVYGCSTFLNSETSVFFCTSEHPLFPNGESLSESKAVALSAGHRTLWNEQGNWSTNHLSDVPQADMISVFEALVDVYRPHTVLLPAPSYNQDHRAVTEAALTALRPHDTNFFVKRILLFEQPETFGTLRRPTPFNASFYVALGSFYKKKTLYEIYLSQQRGHRTWDMIDAIGRLRGMQCNAPYAEAFEVKRWVE